MWALLLLSQQQTPPLSLGSHSHTHGLRDQPARECIPPFSCPITHPLKNPQQLLWHLALNAIFEGVWGVIHRLPKLTSEKPPIKTLFTAAQLLFQSHSEHSSLQIFFNKSLLLSFHYLQLNTWLCWAIPMTKLKALPVLLCSFQLFITLPKLEYQ